MNKKEWSLLLALAVLSILVPTIILLVRYGIELKRLETTKTTTAKEVEKWFTSASETSKLKIHLFKETNWNYSEFKKLNRLVDCESNWKVDALGDNSKALGLAQFWEATFNQFKEEADMPELEYRNPRNQLSLLVWAFQNGKQNHWTTFKRISSN